MRRRHLILLGPLVVAALVTVGVATGGVPGAPTVTAPDDMVAPATEPAGATVIYPLATATDDVGVTDGPTCTPASGVVLQRRRQPTHRDLHSQGRCGQIGSDSFTVTVTALRRQLPSRRRLRPTTWSAPCHGTRRRDRHLPVSPSATGRRRRHRRPDLYTRLRVVLQRRQSAHDTVTCTAKDAAVTDRQRQLSP